MASVFLDDFLRDDGDVSGDTLLGRFLDYTAGKGLTLYPAQEEALLCPSAGGPQGLFRSLPRTWMGR